MLLTVFSSVGIRSSTLLKQRVMVKEDCLFRLQSSNKLLMHVALTRVVELIPFIMSLRSVIRAL